MTKIQGFLLMYLLLIFRLALPEEWRALRDQDLSDKSGIKGCIFAHASGFIGGNKTKEGALEMAVKSLKIQGIKVLENSS